MIINVHAVCVLIHKLTFFIAQVSVQVICGNYTAQKYGINISKMRIVEIIKLNNIEK